MQAMLLCCIEESRWIALPEAERDAVMRDYGAWVADLERSGQHRATEKLAWSQAARTLRLRGGKPVVTDGPYAETKEQFGGFHIVECKDMDEALAIASRIPTLRVGGTIEVRPVEARV
ncbi:MAG TPA: YciI family protein [Steroidobacteraceae bacterium]|nr:YciI family protein [Steroidobacteraceae bacterium]